MSVPEPNHQGIYIRNFLTLFVCISLVAYVNYELTEATYDVNQTNSIINSMLKNETYSIGQERLYELHNGLKTKQYSELSQAECLVRIYLDVLNNQKFTSQTSQKTDQVQLNFTQLTFPSTLHDLKGFKYCSDILTMMNFLNPIKTDFIYSIFMQQKYGSFIAEQQNQETKSLQNIQKQAKFCIISYQTNTSSHKLRHNINSLIEQSYQDYKLVILDNGSTDGSYEIAKVILQDLKQKLIEQNKQKEKQIKQKYQIIHENSRLGLWQLFKKHDQHCSGMDYVLFIDGRDELTTTYVLNIINKKIMAQKEKPHLITSPILKKKQLSRQSPVSIENLNDTDNYPSFTFKVLSLDLYNSIKQKMFQQTKNLTHPYQIQNSFTKTVFDYCIANNKQILQIDEMLYLYDTIDKKQKDRNEYFIKSVKQENQKATKKQNSTS